MRILTLSNFYPPFYLGGYELGCKGVMDSLRARGHTIRVLTSTHGVGEKPAEDEADVHREIQMPITLRPAGTVFSLSLESLLRRERHNRAVFERVCDAFRPDILYCWNLQHISIALPFLAQRRGLPVAYFVSDPWLSRWEKDLWYNQCHYTPQTPFGYPRKYLVHLIPPLLGVPRLPRDLDLRHVQFASRFLKQAALKAGKPVADAAVIHWGVDVERFAYRRCVRRPSRLLYVGQIAPHKGVHTVFEALNRIVREPEHRTVQLTVAGGGGFYPEYAAGIHELVGTLGLESNVRFTGMMPPEALSPLYHENDILVFPSVWEEPFGITPLEAMSSGLAVVGTATGGSPELFEHDVNSLVFPVSDARECAAQILRLLSDPPRYEEIRQRGRQTIEERFTFDQMVDKIEGALEQAVGAH